jgi:hypothetical protein
MTASTRFQTARQAAALVTAVSLLLPSVRVVRAEQAPNPPVAPPPTTKRPPASQPSTAKPPATQPSTAKPPIVLPTGAAPSLGDAAVDGGWPRAYTTNAGARLLIYQPQIASWELQKDMIAYAAVAYQAKSAAMPALGTVTIEADTNVSLDSRLVRFTRIRVTESSFPSLERDQVRDLTDALVDGIPEADRIIALDRVLESVDRSQIRPTNVEGVKSDPPVIFFSTRSSILVNLDGEPIWSPIPENDLKYAVNTNWDLFQHEPSKTYYLRNERVWMKSTGLYGPWVAAGSLPPSFSKLPNDENWKEVKSSLSGAGSKAAIPQVFLITIPAELISVQGNPIYTSVRGASPLVWLQNTEADVFRMGMNGPMYYLVAGRWFTAPGPAGPWTFATPRLPDVFKKIPLEHPRSRVLASVPGTPQSAEAILLSQVPQTARVNIRETKAPDVEFQGDPMFEAIPMTRVSRAVNTDKDIIKVGDLYYMCFQGVWFMSRNATGPWEVAQTVPKEIYEIPASSPAHNVTYVTVVEDDDDEWVTFAAVAGYTGMMVAYGCVVWGSGWYYPPYVWYGGFYPVYYPFYPTYGFSAWYNPWTGAYGRGAAWYGPYGGMGASARYNPRTGTYSRSAVAWGPYGARGVGEAYNPRTGTYARTSQGSGVYGSWGSTSVQRGDQWAQTARVTNRVTGNTTRVTQGSGGGEAITRRGPGGTSGIARTGSGDVYAGRDGNVYRRQEGGGWEKYDNGGWSPAERPTPSGDRAATAGDRAAQAGERGATARGGDTVGQLDRDRTARSNGTTRTRDYGGVQRSGGSSRSGSGGTYRPRGGGGGGGFRGGGRRR